MYLLCFSIAFFACVLGKICGMGGGVIIKPVLDASGLFSVASINFMSGCTVIGMGLWSVGKSSREEDSPIDWKISTPLAIGAAIGGLLGKALFDQVAALFPNADMAGSVQAALLFVATGATLVYTIRRDKIHSYHVENFWSCGLIGLFLGTLGSFLGIGGGPFNMAVFFLFFSMGAKVAAQNSIYVILISQGVGIFKTIFSGKMPQVDWLLLAGMVLLGILGSEIGGRINKKLTDRTATILLEISMILIMGINVYNMIRFLG